MSNVDVTAFRKISDTSVKIQVAGHRLVDAFSKAPGPPWYNYGEGLGGLASLLDKLSDEDLIAVLKSLKNGKARRAALLLSRDVSDLQKLYERSFRPVISKQAKSISSSARKGINKDFKVLFRALQEIAQVILSLSGLRDVLWDIAIEIDKYLELDRGREDY